MAIRELSWLNVAERQPETQWARDPRLREREREGEREGKREEGRDGEGERAD